LDNHEISRSYNLNGLAIFPYELVSLFYAIIIDTMDFQILDWDSRFFGLKTAGILARQLNQSHLTKLLSILHKNNIKLAYWASDEAVEYDIASLGGRLVDRKTTFEVNLTNLQPEVFTAADRVKPYQPGDSQPELLDLAVLAGEYSRFKRDPSFPHDLFVALYHEWMRKCIRKEMAREILILQEMEKIAGMVTLGEKEGKGDIGLIAVGKEHQGKGFGELLVRAAQKWSLGQGYAYAQVVTQRDNLPACSLYKKCGYKVRQVEYFYHFWL
jgi:dTDP-4-amino-4,6-dideoxy-D-galactose acyltransferase